MNQSNDDRLDKALTFIQRQKQQIEQLRGRITRLEEVIEHCLGNEHGTWLWLNRKERMDPNVPIFDPVRAAFHLARYEFATGYSRERIACDVACGTGYGARILVDRGKSVLVEGFDQSQEAVNYATNRYGCQQVRFNVASAYELPVPENHFELITSFETIEHLESPGIMIEEFARVLKPSGVLICSTPNAWPLEIAEHHLQVFDRQSFVKLLETRFRVCSLYNQNSGTDWPYNHGQPAGYVPTTDQNYLLAECYIAVCELS